MPDQNLVDKIRKETYLLDIYKAFDNNSAISHLTAKLTKAVQDIYRYLEPSHFDGKLIIYMALENENVLDEEDATIIYDKNFLIDKSSKDIVLQITSDDRLLLWENIDVTDIFDNRNALFYCYENKKEYFYANTKKIEIVNPFICSSIYSLQYHFLKEALDKYKIDKILHSSCEKFEGCWYDGKHIFFKSGPEKTIQESLAQYLSISLRGVDTVREYTLGASKPVDVRVYWKEANRAALIELKWLGKTMNDNGTLSVNYTNSRATEGLKQLKEYLDLEAQDTPTCITKGYLVVIDGRRRRAGADTTEISCSDGLHYQNKELDIPEENRYFESIKNFEKPIRMFTRPICN